MNEPTLGMIEFKSVARGILSTDAIVKKASVRILETHPVCPGKYVTVFCGEVAEVKESLEAGLEVGGDLVVNHLFIPYLHESVIPAITATTEIKEFGAIGVIETFSITTCVVAADIAAKAADIKLIEIRLSNGLGGKGYFVMTGPLTDVEAAMEKAKEYASKDGLLTSSSIIENPHPDLLEKGVYW